MAFKDREPLFVPDAAAETRWHDVERVRSAGLGSVLMVPLVCQQQSVGVLGLDAPQFTAAAPPKEADLRRLNALGAIVAAALRNSRLFDTLELERARPERLMRQRRELHGTVALLRGALREGRDRAEIVGSSVAMQGALSHVDLVATADTTVLILGETVTGKELIARAIHERSRRTRAPFIAVNCAALPDTLIESELFGHEKGTFTGAVARKCGKFELANGGTLFLDEIGDMPLPAQAKLLRVLQEREVHRVGGATAVPVNVRLIAATNQPLDIAIHDGRFRADLYYRLAVFPIRVPPLRERRDDVVCEGAGHRSTPARDRYPPRHAGGRDRGRGDRPNRRTRSSHNRQTADRRRTT